jgi:GNAT superfamily N-acetyltransferase
MNVEVFPACERQAELIYRIMRAAYAEYEANADAPFAAHDETLEDVRAAVRAGGAVLAHFEGVAIGSARYRFDEDHHFVIERVAVLPGFRGCGAASAMLRALEATALSYGCVTTELCSRLSLPRNLALYERRGYAIEQVDSQGRVRLCKRLTLAEAEPAHG